MTINSDLTDPNRARLRWALYALICGASLASMCSRIVQVSTKYDTPFLSANDRSRWCTIRSLVEDGTYSIDKLHRIQGWHTIDKIRHRDETGKFRYYSSKPPLFPTILAGEYYAIKKTAEGLRSPNAPPVTLENPKYYVARLMLVLTNVVPMLVYFTALGLVIEKWGVTDFGRIFTMTTAAFGTFLTTFAVTLNNHLPAAISVMLALYAANELWYQRRTSWWLFPLAGVGAAFAAANELPALSFLGLLGLGLLGCVNRATWFSFLLSVVGVLVVVAAFFGTNYVAHDSFIPPYAHREEVTVGVTEYDGPHDNWYYYPGSYWFENKDEGNIDNGEPSKRVYLFNMMVGHHGFFSLTPVWALSVLGCWLLLVGKNKKPAFVMLILTLSAVCIAFYAVRPLNDRNYGGVSCGLRWLFWLIPMWLLALQPAADFFARSRATQLIAIILLMASIFSAGYATLNPWSHPWIYQYWQYIEWI